MHFFDPEAAASFRVASGPAVVQIHNLTLRDRAVGAPWRSEGRVALELLRSERLACRRARWLLANSREVADPLRAIARHAQVEVAPLALDPAHYSPPASLEHPIAGLIGTARWAPTKNAVARLLRSVWPRVLERRPGSRLLLAGVGMERSAFADLPEPSGVEWRGSVDSATAFLRELGLLLYPLTAGSGTKVKVLEAMALGLPVVTTPDGAEGIADLAGLVVERDDELLARAVVSLLDDPVARRAAGARAHASFTRQHTPKSAAAPVVRLYERMLAGRRMPT
ncbi:MAG TPA: glycosyltransferase family 4 protein [Solirubrobacteraceae bacterium]|nr:glycosyltransferase family 4 protein [Solirubrobacteraceae bacterium]